MHAGDIMMKRVHTVVALLFAILCTAPVSAQPVASSFDQVQWAVKSGQRIGVRTVDGSGFAGRVLGATPSTLTIDVDHQPREFRDVDIHPIQRWRFGRPSKRDLIPGAVIGFITGGIASGESKGFGVLVGVVYGSVTTAISAGLRTITPRRQTIYDRRRP